MANLDNIVGALRAYGLNVVETPGWITRGYGSDLQAIKGVLWHHTATNRAAFNNSNAPTLNMCINGRSDLAGPLCNLVFGRDGTVYVVATGVANHAGAGVAHGIPRDTGNHFLIGIEMESSGIAPWDWTPEQLRFAPLLGAALELIYLQGLPEGERLQLAHYEYSSQGKIDPAGWPGGMDGLRASINAKINELRGGTPSPAAPTPAPAPATPAPSRKTYSNDEMHWVVESGDTLSKIARHYYGDARYAQQIADYNGIAVNSTLNVGDRIWVNGPIVWTVEGPDEIRTIAAYYGIHPNWIVARNRHLGITHADSEIFVGWNLNIL